MTPTGEKRHEHFDETPFFRQSDAGLGDRIGISEALMKRDMDLIRDLLLKIENADAKPSWKDLISEGMDNDEVTKILEHLKLLKEADPVPREVGAFGQILAE